MKLSIRREMKDLGLELDYVLFDGNQPNKVEWQLKSIVNSVGLSISIATSSIIAKVTRDKLMQELDDQNPEYY